MVYKVGDKVICNTDIHPALNKGDILYISRIVERIFGEEKQIYVSTKSCTKLYDYVNGNIMIFEYHIVPFSKQLEFDF